MLVESFRAGSGHIANSLLPFSCYARVRHTCTPTSAASIPRLHLDVTLGQALHCLITFAAVIRCFHSDEPTVAQAAEALLSEMVSRAPRGTPASIFNLLQV